MGVFFALFIYLIIIHLVWGDNKDDKSRLRLTIMGGFGIWIILALRSPYCGVDLSVAYYRLFLDVNDLTISDSIFHSTLVTGMEPGWVVLTKFISYITDSFQVYLAIIAAIQVALIIPILYKYGKSITFGWIVYFCFGLYIMSFSGIRQATAYCLTFFSFDFLMRDKKILFSALVVLASTIHVSALIFLFMLIGDKTKLNGWILVISIFVMVLLIPLLKPIVIYLGGILYSTEKAISKVDGTSSINLFLLYVVLLLLSLIKQNKNKRYNFILFAIVAATFSQATGIVSIEMPRIGYYFSMFFMLYLPELFDSFKSNKNMLYIIGSLFMIFFFWYGNRNGYLNVIPYRFFWETPALF